MEEQKESKREQNKMQNSQHNKMQNSEQNKEQNSEQNKEQKIVQNKKQNRASSPTPSDRQDLTLREAQQLVDGWIKTYGVRYFSELTNMACLTEEVGELARVIARTYGDQSFKAGERPNLGEEMADVLWVLMCLANQTGVDLTDELKKSFEKKTRRDAERHKRNEKLKDGNAPQRQNNEL